MTNDDPNELPSTTMTNDGPNELPSTTMTNGEPNEPQNNRTTAEPHVSDTLRLQVTGMTCASCVQRVERALLKVPGVTQATVNLADETARVDAPGVDRDELVAAVEKAGYHIKSDDGNETETPQERQARRTLRHFIIAALLATPVVLLAMGPHVLPGFPHIPGGLWIQFALTTPIQFWLGARFYKGSYQALRQGYANMDVLVALGTSAAYGYSVVALLLGDHAVYFETAALLIAFILLGKYLEARSKGRAASSIRRLLELQPAVAIVQREGRWVELATEEVQVGDRIRVRPGEKVPTDGRILDGTSTLDQHMVTGESVPVAKGPGDAVIGGTLNTTGGFVMEATRVGSGTMLAEIVRLVQEAQSSKAPVQRFVDRVSAIFVPIVVGIAAVTFLFWWLYGTAVFGTAGQEPYVFALILAAAVLVIACPCALGLATPTAMMVGTGKAAERGVLIKSGETLERTRGIDTVLFDKTGTLTVGRPQVTEVVPVAGVTSDALLTVAASLESASEHPLAQAVIAAARRRGLVLQEPSRFSSATGQGIRASIDGVPYQIGTRGFVAERGVDTAPLQDAASRLSADANTVIWIARVEDERSQVLGLIAAKDTLKPGAREAVAELHRMGLQVAMVSGDNQATAEAIGREAGIDQVHAEVLPADKAAVVRRLQQEGHTVAMVGDGINDAPALAQADIGIAMAGGTDVAIETGDIVLVNGELMGVAEAIRMSGWTLAKIRQNLVLAFLYNVLAIPVAAGALYPTTGLLLRPELAGLAMALSSVSVVLNALWLGVRIDRLGGGKRGSGIEQVPVVRPGMADA